MTIPVTFEHKGKQYKGQLSKVAGAGKLYHLMIKGIFQGQLFYSDHRKEWQFSSQQGYDNKLAVEFGERVERG